MKIKSIHLENILSFEKLDLELEDITYIIGPNNSGKSNVARAMSLLKELTREHYPHIELADYVKKGGEGNQMKIELHIILSDEETTKIRNYVEILGEAYYDRIRNKLNEVKGKNKRLNSLLETISMNSPVSKKNYSELWNLSIVKFFDEVFSNKKITFVIEHPGIHWGVIKKYILIDENLKLDMDEKIAHTDYSAGAPYLSFERLFERAADIEVVWIKGEAEDPIEQLARALRNNIKNIIFIEKGAIDISLKGIGSSRECLRKKLFTEVGYNVDPANVISLYRIIETWIYSYIQTSDSIRSYFTENTLYDLAIDEDWHPVSSSNLPLKLFKLKNSPNLRERQKFAKIQEDFKRLMGYSFDVSANIRYTEEKVQEVTTTSPYYIPVKGGLLEVKEGNFKALSGTIRLNLESETHQYDFYFAGAGSLEVLYVLTLIEGMQDKIILLDEPALNLHPSMQSKLLEILLQSDVIEQNQLIIITHSPYLVLNLADLKKMPLIIYRFNLDNYKTVNKKITYKDTSSGVMEILNANKKVLFADLVVVVEGDADKYIFDRIFNDLNLAAKNIEILPGGGGASIEVYKLLKKWGIKAVYICDKDKEQDINNDKELKNDPCVLVLHSDLEGTMIIGDILHELNKCLSKKGLKLRIKKEIEKFKDNYKKDRKKLQVLEKRLKEVKNKGASLEELIKIFYTDSEEDYGVVIEEKDQGSIKNELKNTLEKLSYFIKMYKELGNTKQLDFAIKIIKHDIFFNPIPAQVREFFDIERRKNLFNC